MLKISKKRFRSKKIRKISRKRNSKKRILKGGENKELIILDRKFNEQGNLKNYFFSDDGKYLALIYKIQDADIVKYSKELTEINKKILLKYAEFHDKYFEKFVFEYNRYAHTDT